MKTSAILFTALALAVINIAFAERRMALSAFAVLFTFKQYVDPILLCSEVAPVRFLRRRQPPETAMRIMKVRLHIRPCC